MAKADGLLPKFLHFQTHIKYTDDSSIEVQLENVTDHDWLEVVRCRDCRENDKTGYETADFGYCNCLHMEVQDCFFCKHGERREAP